MEIAGTAAHEASHVRRSPPPSPRSRATVVHARMMLRPSRSASRVASCDSASRRIVTTTKRYSDCALSGFADFFSLRTATKGGSLCNRWSEAARRRRGMMTSNGKNVRRWTSHRALVGSRRGWFCLSVARERLRDFSCGRHYYPNGIQLSSLQERLFRVRKCGSERVSQLFRVKF